MEGQFPTGADAARVPPNHPESERGVLGAMLRSREAALLAIETLQAGGLLRPRQP